LNFGAVASGELERAHEVLGLVGLGDFLVASRQGMGTRLGDGGVSISGGEAQRISLARALFSNPGLLVLDEATSALDNETQDIVLRAIRGLKGSMTVIAIAHRQETISDADMVIKIESGNTTRLL
jgi:ABC-type multidrug transport system fused ATPase/permease subunit